VQRAVAGAAKELSAGGALRAAASCHLPECDPERPCGCRDRGDLPLVRSSEHELLGAISCSPPSSVRCVRSRSEVALSVRRPAARLASRPARGGARQAQRPGARKR
jgi:hypothetical protein